MLARCRMWLTWATNVDLVQRHAKFRCEILLDERAGFMLHLEVLLEDIVLLFRKAWLHVAGGRFLVRSPACILRRAGRVHSRHAAKSDRVVSHDLRRLEECSSLC
jgi:hypothetical protein